MYITFNSQQQVSKIKVEKNVRGKFVPEAKMAEVSIRLPGFNLRSDKPTRKP